MTKESEEKRSGGREREREREVTRDPSGPSEPKLGDFFLGKQKSRFVSKRHQ